MSRNFRLFYMASHQADINTFRVIFNSRQAFFGRMILEWHVLNFKHLILLANLPDIF